MARSQLSETGARQAALWLDEIVSDYRNQGHTRERAIDFAAAFVGLTARRVKAVLYGEPCAFLDVEESALKRRYLAHLDSQAAHHQAKYQALRERRRQLEIAL